MNVIVLGWAAFERAKEIVDVKSEIANNASIGRINPWSFLRREVEASESTVQFRTQPESPNLKCRPEYAEISTPRSRSKSRSREDPLLPDCALFHSPGGHGCLVFGRTAEAAVVDSEAAERCQGRQAAVGVEGDQVGEHSAEREGLGRIAERVDEGIVPASGVANFA